MIDRFENEFAFISNFYELPNPIAVGDIIFDTNEHFFQAHKTLNLIDRVWIAYQTTPGAAKKAGSKKGIGTRKIQLREDWLTARFDVMLVGLVLKYMNNYGLAGRLMQTHPRTLVEGNWWHDNFWGNCTCENCVNIEGQNHLGLQSMQVRKMLLAIRI